MPSNLATKELMPEWSTEPGWSGTDILTGYWLSILSIVLQRAFVSRYIKYYLFSGKHSSFENEGIYLPRVYFPHLWNGRVPRLSFQTGFQSSLQGRLLIMEIWAPLKQRGSSLSGLLTGIHSAVFVCRKDLWKLAFVTKKKIESHWFK